jgi:primosomal protein N' (replication factor Y)
MSQLFASESEQIVGYANVALEQGVDVGSGLTYGIPRHLAPIAVGERVIVPLGRGNKPIAGTVVELRDTAGHDRIKAIVSRDPQGISLPPDLIDLARWMAGYYCCPLGMVIGTMLPAAVKHGTGSIVQTLVELPDALPDPLPKLTKLQQAVLNAARQRRDEGEPRVSVRELADLAGARTVAPVKQLVDKKLLTVTQAQLVRSEWDDWMTPPGSPAHAPGSPAPGNSGNGGETSASSLTLNDHQALAVRRLADTVHAGFQVHLLHGVTGSGKTEVYLRVIEHLLKGQPAGDKPRGAIMLVPEIALTPQTAARFLARFGRVAILHSGLTAAQRHEQWRRIRNGEADIVVGARSAIFAPHPNVGVIIVDEEQETSYKQDQLPRYHARDVAIKRGQLLNVPVVLGSATPSLESYFNATTRGRYHLLSLPQRVGGMQMPKVQIVDMIEQRRIRGGVHLISTLLEDLLGHTLRQQGQAILLLNRRGYANYIACPDHRCGWMKMCEHCDATMIYHKDQALPAGGLVRCHHCTAEQMLEKLCPLCGKKITVFGLGTQRVEEELTRKFPKARVLRMDSDAMRTGRDYHASLQRFAAREVDVLVGTQMIAKGLDFPNVRLVGVISGDTSLHMPDFRAAERTFQLIAQVAGRAGRSMDAGKPGLVVVQSFNPDDPAITLAAAHDYEGFAARELALREQVGLPPYARMVRIVIRDRDHVACAQQARTLADHLIRYNHQMGEPARLRGPAPCPIGRIAEFYRQQIELLAPDPGGAAALQKLLTALRNDRLLVSDAGTAVDVDPVSLL